jgi:hypothetical protein
VAKKEDKSLGRNGQLRKRKRRKERNWKLKKNPLKKSRSNLLKLLKNL